jgi:hypothetical protein
LTRSAGSISILKKIQNGVVLVKKKNKSQWVATRFLTGFCWVNRVAGSAGLHRVMAYSIFSSTRPGSSPRPAGSRIDPPGQAGFQNYALSIEFLAGYYLMKVPYQLKAGTVVVWFRFSA